MDQAIIRTVEQRVAQRYGGTQAAGQEGGVDGVGGVAADQPGGDQRMGVEGGYSQLLVAGIDQGHQRARRQRLGLGRHVDFVAEGPGVARAQAARAALGEADGGTGGCVVG
jgi:hypothetical protein